MNININGDTSYQQSPIKKGTITCPVCGNTDDWDCSETIDGGLVFCKYISSDKTAKDGRYIHIRNNGQSGIPDNPQPIAEPIESKNRKADADKLNEVYTAFLTSLPLNEAHSNNLIKERGLSEQIVDENGYASVPSYEQRFETAEKLAQVFDLEGIPGFYQDNGKWALNLTFDGFYIPYRDEQGRIVGLQVRLDKNSGNKYMWLSSAGRDNGTSSGVPLHFVNPEKVRETKEIYVTEGALKADIIGEIYNVGVAAMGGVNVLKAEDFVAALLEAFPDLERVVVAFDMDWQEKAEVKTALASMLEAVSSTSLSASVLTWDRTLGKGFDDFLVNYLNKECFLENPYSYIEAEEFKVKFLSQNKQEMESKKDTENTALFEEQAVVNEDFMPENMGLKEEVVVKEPAKTFGITARDFLKMDFPYPEKVMFGLGRGNVGLMVASTNIGKTTLALNLSLSIGMNKPFAPLFDDNHKARRVMYIDGEATKADLQADILKMMEICSEAERELIKDNLCFICDEELGDEPLDLVNPEHLRIVTEKAKEFKPDLIIIDTLSALITMEDENDNAKVKKEVIQPLKNLGKKAETGVLLLHHTGKFNEGSPQAEDAYKGRGASAFGALARVVFNLKPVKGSNKVNLSCSKVKSGKFEQVVIELDQDTRWFKEVEKSVVQNSKRTHYEQVVKVVKGFGRKVKRQEIEETLKAKEIDVSTSTLTKILTEAVEINKDLSKPSYGYYGSPVNPEVEMPLKE